MTTTSEPEGMSMEIKVLVLGCDDVTVVVLDVTEDEMAVIDRLAVAVNAASEYTCQPTMTVRGEPDERG